MAFPFVLRLVTVALQLSFVFSQNLLNEECIVKETQRFDLQGNSNISLIFFISHEDSCIMRISFVGRETFKDSDFVEIDPETVTLQRKRYGISTSEYFDLDHKLPIGWNSINISTNDQQLNIGSYHNLTGFEYPISEVSITAKYLTKCVNNTPTWKIEDSNGISIPLTGLSHAGLTLVNNEKPFLPVLTLNDLEIPLSYDEELVVRKSKIPLPADSYHMKLRKFNNTISIYTGKRNAEFKQLLNANMKQNLSRLSLKAVEGSFHLILDPFEEYYVDKELTMFKQNHSMPMMNEGAYENDNVSDQIRQLKDANSNSSAPESSIRWKIATGVLSAVTGILFISNIYLMKDKISSIFKQRFNQENRQDSGMEEGQSLLLDERKVYIKDIVRSTCTESHGETNQQMNPHHKEVCNIKLKHDETFTSRKKIGDLDSNKKTKVILVIGQTGSGKSSFINVMLNFIYGVSYDDSFRFRLINDLGRTSTEGIGSTKEITAYYIPFMHGIENNCNYIFVDTPGFDDTKDFDNNHSWNHMLYEFLNKNQDISEVDGICFVIKETNTRITLKQEYTINGLFSKFGKDIKNNIYVVVSFSDGSNTNVPKLLKKSGLDYKKAFQFNSKGLYDSGTFNSNSCEEIQLYNKSNWKLNVRNMEAFFKDIIKTQSVNLSLTNIVLEENKDIEEIKDELLQLYSKDDATTDEEKQDIQSRIEQNQKLLILKIDEAQKLSGRLENIPCKENPLVINDYIDVLIQDEEDKSKISKLQKLKERNAKFQNLMKENSKSSKNFVQLIFGEKNEKTE